MHTAALVPRLTSLLGPDAVLTHPAERAVYECDGYTIEKNKPEVVVFPTTTEQVAAVVRLCNEAGVPFLGRGAGTSLAGGCVPVGGGVVIALTRMKRILEINVRDGYAVAEAGVVNAWLTAALAPHGRHYAPDPSSQGACTLGGNLATNAGGPHTLKYGVTVNHVLGLELVLPDGTVVVTGGPAGGPGYDLTGVVVGSEGTFGIVTKAWVRLTRNPPAVRTLLGVFATVDDATQCISDLIGAGIVPAALELIDQTILRAVEDAFHFGFPPDAGAVLIMEVDGPEAGLGEEADRIAAIARRNHAVDVKAAATTAERLLLWKCRKQAFGAIGRLAPSYCTQDGVVPRTKLPDILRFIRATADKFQLQIANVFHAGDGNIHPVLLFDERDPAQTRRVLDAGAAILRECVRLGGSVTGEHGIGVEKRDFLPDQFSPASLDAMIKLRSAFNPQGNCSPDKLLPVGGGCHEAVKPGRRAAV
jgi:glycolate oxidase